MHAILPQATSASAVKIAGAWNELSGRVETVGAMVRSALGVSENDIAKINIALVDVSVMADFFLRSLILLFIVYIIYNLLFSSYFINAFNYRQQQQFMTTLYTVFMPQYRLRLL